MNQKQTTALIILDGFGHREETDNNAIALAHTPHIDRLREGPSGLISGSGVDVGLPAGQMGNSEVGHMNLGAGRVVHQDFIKGRKIMAAMLPLMSVLEQGGKFGQCIKHATALRGLPAGPPRNPLAPLNESEQAALAEVIQKMNNDIAAIQAG